MNMPKYDGVLERWKVDLVIHRARRHGFKPHEMPDVLQEATLVLLEFRYDSDHDAGATERTALTAVVDNRLSKMRRSATRYRLHLECFARRVPEFSPEEVDLCMLDVLDALDHLSDRERTVCFGLAEGLSIAGIARRLGCGWHTVKRTVDGLRERFEANGLKGWVSA